MYIKLFEDFINEAKTLNENGLLIENSAADVAKKLKSSYNTRYPSSDQKFNNDSKGSEAFYGKIILMGDPIESWMKGGSSVDQLKDGDHKLYPIIFNGDGNSGGTSLVFKPITLKKEGNNITFNNITTDAKTLDTAIEFNNKNAAETKRAQGPGFNYDKKFFLLFGLEK